MDWLKDKKNQPFVIAGAIILILGCLSLTLFELGVFNQSNPTPKTPIAAGYTPPMPGMPGASGVPGPTATASFPPGAPGMPGSGPGMPGGMPRGLHAGKHHLKSSSAASAQTASAASPAATPGDLTPVNTAAVRDPFAVPSLSKPKLIASIKKAVSNLLPPIRSILPDQNIYSGVSAQSQVPPQPRFASNLPGLPGMQSNTYRVASLPRVAGIIKFNGVHAILQSSYESQSVNPGDDIGGVGRVMSIQSNSITVKTTDGQTIQIPITAGSPGGYGGGYGGGYPGGPMGYAGGPGGYPGAPGNYPGMPGGGYPRAPGGYPGE